MTRNWKHTSKLALHATFSLSKSAHPRGGGDFVEARDNSGDNVWAPTLLLSAGLRPLRTEENPAHQGVPRRSVVVQTLTMGCHSCEQGKLMVQMPPWGWGCAKSRP